MVSEQFEPRKSDPTQAVRSLSMDKASDRKYLERAISSGWPINHDDMARFYGLLKWAAQKAQANDDIRELNSCIRTMTVIVGQVQSDQQLAEKYGRVDEGLGTESVDHRLVHYVNAPREEL